MILKEKRRILPYAAKAKRLIWQKVLEQMWYLSIGVLQFTQLSFLSQSVPSELAGWEQVSGVRLPRPRFCFYHLQAR